MGERSRREQEEDMDRRMTMMSRKNRKLLRRMLHSSSRKNEQAGKLRAKRRSIKFERNLFFSRKSLVRYRSH